MSTDASSMSLRTHQICFVPLLGMANVHSTRRTIHFKSMHPSKTSPTISHRLISTFTETSSEQPLRQRNVNLRKKISRHDSCLCNAPRMYQYARWVSRSRTKLAPDLASTYCSPTWPLCSAEATPQKDEARNKKGVHTRIQQIQKIFLEGPGNAICLPPLTID